MTSYVPNQPSSPFFTSHPHSYTTAAPVPLQSSLLQVESTKQPIPISHEYDLLLSNHKSTVVVDRSNWLSKVLEETPEVRELRECVNPIARAALFGRLYLPPNRLIPHQLLLALISQHLRTLGLTDSQASLHSEWGSDLTIPPHKLYSQLSLLVQRGLHRAERFWELSMPSVHAPDDEIVVQKALDEEISRTIGAAPKIIEDKNPLIHEKPHDPNFLKLDEEKKDIKAASLNQLIYLVTSQSDSDSPDLLSALCLTINSYATTKIFFSKLIDRFNMLLQTSQNESDSEKKKSIVLQITLTIKLFKEWIRVGINDLEPQILDSAKQYVEIKLKPDYSTYINQIFEIQNEAIESSSLKPPVVQLGKCKNIWTGSFSLFELPVQELARQLTVWSSSRYHMIGKNELLGCAWEKPRLKYRAPNLIALTQHFNRMSNWVALEILTTSVKNQRLDKMKYLIDLMKELDKMNNLFDANSILGGFESNSIHRLELHFSLLSQDSKKILEDMKIKFDPSGSFASLREAQKILSTSSDPCVPYIGMFLGDLFKYDDSTPLYIDKLINVKKMLRVYELISSMLSYSRFRYNFLSVDQVQRKIDQLHEVDEDYLYDLSTEVEPDGTVDPSLLKDQ